MSAPRSDDPAIGETLVDLHSAPTLDGSDLATTLRRNPAGTTLTSESVDVRPVGPFAAGDSEPRFVAATLAPPSMGDLGTRYEKKRLLGEGGMGEVSLYADAFVGRDVAMKIVRAHAGSQSDAKARFLREARVQGQLEHPSVVPVYDIGTSPSGELYFTMKRIAGLTLEEIVEGLREKDPRIVEEFSRRRLLSAVSQVCLALAFAHARGVVHRDLKPANVMLGDFGEVYVLDWGIAKVGGLADLPPLTTPSEPLSTEDIAKTRAGALLGTPGYMAPEQARGDASTVDGRADVYALGVILFELLTQEPFHHGDSVMELISKTLVKVEARPKLHAVDIPPELDDICAKATSLSLDDRFASAREMHVAIERFLDGEKDLERRRSQALSHAEDAVRAIASVQNGEAGGDEKRASALRSLGTALALDPDQGMAQKTLLTLLVDDDTVLPPEAEKELFEVNLRDRAKVARSAMFAFASWFVAAPLVVWMGIRDWKGLLALSFVLIGIIGLLNWIWRTNNAHPRYVRIWMGTSFIAVSLLSVLFGPLVLVPQVAVASGAAMIVGIRANAITRRAITFFALLASLGPLALSWVGVLPTVYTVETDRIVIHPYAVGFPPVPTFLLLLAATISGIALSTHLLGQGVQALVGAERRTFARAYRLKQMFPSLDSPGERA